MNDTVPIEKLESEDEEKEHKQASLDRLILPEMPSTGEDECEDMREHGPSFPKFPHLVHPSLFHVGIDTIPLDKKAIAAETDHIPLDFPRKELHTRCSTHGTSLWEVLPGTKERED